MAVLVSGCAALAQSESASTTAEFAADDEVLASRRFEASLVGGLGGFTGSLSGVTDIGPLFGAQVDVRLGGPLHLEAAYLGFELPLTDTRVVRQQLWGHGVSAMLKASWSYTRTMHPFLAVGAGALVVDPTQGANSLYTEDVVGLLPAAAGIEFTTDFFQAGLRVRWEALLNERIADPSLVGRSAGGLLTGGLTLGIRI